MFGLDKIDLTIHTGRTKTIKIGVWKITSATNYTVCSATLSKEKLSNLRIYTNHAQTHSSIILSKLTHSVTVTEIPRGLHVSFL